ncbi:MAG: ABC transporter ATP-binding protein [Candidatus Micrarchaeaceae archaeon]
MSAKVKYPILLEHISKIYGSKGVEYVAIKDISLSVARGEFVAVLGPSGSGKTTLLDIAGTLDRPTRGKVFIDGIEVSRLNDREISKIRNEKIGFVFQSYNLVPYLSVLDNVMLPLMVNGTDDEQHRELAKQRLKEVGLGSKLENKPNEISGGEQQRVAIVRAIMNNPPLLLADEPTGNLDSVTAKDVMNLLIRIGKENDTTILMVTHDIDLAKYAERRVYIRDGLIEKEVR